jgi:hypothetical protein
VQAEAYEMTTLVVLFVVQLTIALANVAFYCLGLSYMDDNSREHESAALIGGALAAKYWGSQFGLGVSLLVGFTPFGWWLGWAILAPPLFVAGLFIALFPKRLLSTVVRLAANNIIETATNTSQLSLSQHKLLADINFFPSIRRLLSNKILMFNVIATVFLETAIFNFVFHESNYLQSRFFLPSSEADGINNEWTSRTVTFLLKPPLVALSILVAGLIIAKANPSVRYVQ